MPQLRETGLNRLTYLRKQELPLRGVLARDEQQLSLFCLKRRRLAAITQVAKQHATIRALTQGEQRLSIITVGGQQHDVQEAARDVPQRMQLETEEPALRAFPKARAVFSHQAHTSMPELVTERNRLGINEVETSVGGAGASGFQQQPNVDGELMQAAQPFGIRRHEREGCAKVEAHQTISLLERGHLKRSLQQRNGQNFRVREAWDSMGRTPPLSLTRMSFQVI